jgi:hypothetical protein
MTRRVQPASASPQAESSPPCQDDARRPSRRSPDLVDSIYALETGGTQAKQGDEIFTPADFRGKSQVATTGTRGVAAVVIVLLVAAVLVVLARVEFWPQTHVSNLLIRLFAWALAAVFLLETLAAASSGARPRLRHPHRTLASH